VKESGQKLPPFYSEGLSVTAIAGYNAIHVSHEADSAMAISIRLPEELEARLAQLARKTGRTKSFYIKEAIVEQIADLEDFYLAEERMRDYDPADNVSLADMIRRHGVAR